MIREERVLFRADLSIMSEKKRQDGVFPAGKSRRKHAVLPEFFWNQAIIQCPRAGYFWGTGFQADVSMLKLCMILEL